MFTQWLSDLDSILKRDPAARTRLEVLFCYPGVHAIGLYRVAHWLWGMGLKFPARLLSSIARILTGIEIHPAARIGRRLFIDHGFGVVIGETAKIGDDVTLYHDVTLGGTSLDKGHRHPQLGNGVIVGAGAQLLGPISIGDNARVGSNAVVIGDVPAGVTVVGVPARPVEEQRRAKAAFEPYGALPDEESDPTLAALHRLEAEMQRLREHVITLEQSQQGIERTAERWEGS